jgi:hypothetical protein
MFVNYSWSCYKRVVNSNNKKMTWKLKQWIERIKEKRKNLKEKDCDLELFELKKQSLELDIKLKQAQLNALNLL